MSYLAISMLTFQLDLVIGHARWPLQPTFLLSKHYFFFLFFLFFFFCFSCLGRRALNYILNIKGHWNCFAFNIILFVAFYKCQLILKLDILFGIQSWIMLLCVFTYFTLFPTVSCRTVAVIVVNQIYTGAVMIACDVDAVIFVWNKTYHVKSH